MTSDPVADLRAAVACSLAACAPEAAPIAVALSGGRDSVVLLDALVAVAAGHGIVALHVDHGLSPNAEAWAAFCADLCAARGIAFVSRRVEVPHLPQTSLEGEARRLRYAALAEAARSAGASVVALAHHRDDQAETLLLQLLRGAGPHGLAAMTQVRADPRGVTWWRPLLRVARPAIDAYAQARALPFVDDESNALPRHRRNAVRHIVMPALRDAGFAAAAATLARAAAHQADAMRLADDLADLDARVAHDGGTLDRAALASLPAHRARNLLRWFLHERGLAPPSAARLADMLAQLSRAGAGAQVCVRHDGAELGLHAGRIHVHGAPPAPFALRWAGEPTLALPHGVLRFAGTTAAGALSAARLESAVIEVRLRRGGERLQVAANRPRRALKALLQDAGLPPWERRALPLVMAGDEVVAVPGVGIACAWHSHAEEPGVAVTWHPASL